MNRVGIYNRCSTEEESQRNALMVQAEESREIAEKKGWCVVAQYIESESGTTAVRRKEYQCLLQAMEEKQFDIVMVKSIDRLTRNTKDWYLFLDSLVRNQIRLYLYLEQKFYQSDDALITGIKAILAEQFSKDLSQKIKNAHRRRQEKRSGFNITRDMFGWEKTGKNTYCICEEEAAYFRQACALVEQGYGYHRIAKKMYEIGARQKNGNRISEVVWRNMLRSPHAHGTVILHETEYDFETKKKVQLPEIEKIVIEQALPPLISKEYHEKILAILDENAKNVREKVVKRQRLENCESAKEQDIKHMLDRKNEALRYPRNYGKHYLSGKVTCASCGAPYYRIKGIWKCSTFLKQGREHGCQNRNISDRELEKQLLLEMLNSNTQNLTEIDVAIKVKQKRNKTKHREGERKYIEIEKQEKLEKENSKQGKSKREKSQLDYDSNIRLQIRYKEAGVQYTQELYYRIENSFKQLILKSTQHNDNDQEATSLQSKMKKLKKDKEKLLNKLLQEVISDTDYQVMAKKIEEEQQLLEQRLIVINQEQVPYIDNKAHFEQLMEIVTQEQLIEKAMLREWCKGLERIYIMSRV